MAEGASRYFYNTLPDYGHIIMPEEHILYSIHAIITTIENYLPPTDENGKGGLYHGTAGIAYMYYHLSRIPTFVETRDEFLMKSLSYLQPAIRISRTADDVSFLLGNAGVFSLATVINQKVNHSSDTNYFRELFYKIENICKQPRFLSYGSDDFLVGRAGYIMAALWLSKETKFELRVSEIYEICNVMVASGRDYATQNDSPCPLMYSFYGWEYLGVSHGLSSILQVLLSVPGYLQAHPSAASDIRKTVDYLLSQQDNEGNFPKSTMDMPVHEHAIIQWCHGAAGVIYLMAKAYLVWHDDKYLRSCKKMADLIWRKGLLKKGSGLCHGVAGNGYAFLLMHRLTRRTKYLHRAREFANFMHSPNFIRDALISDRPFSLLQGAAGKACFLGDLTWPKMGAFPFFDIFE